MDEVSRALAEAGLVACRWVVREKHHYLNPMPLVGIHERWISKFTSHRTHLYARVAALFGVATVRARV